jgi:hypothetical protein
VFLADHLDGGLWHRCIPAPQSPWQCSGAAALIAVRHTRLRPLARISFATEQLHDRKHMHAHACRSVVISATFAHAGVTGRAEPLHDQDNQKLIPNILCDVVRAILPMCTCVRGRLYGLAHGGQLGSSVALVEHFINVEQVVLKAAAAQGCNYFTVSLYHLTPISPKCKCKSEPEPISHFN